MTSGPLDIAQPAGRFLRNLLAVSVAALLVGLVLYVALRPGTAEMLAAHGWPAAQQLLRQALLNGLPVVLVTTWAGTVLHAARPTPGLPCWRGLALAAVDPILRLAVFAVLHVGVYVLAADWFGSFGGDKATALRTVAPTLARAAWLENLSGVYLYAVLAIALPAQAKVIRMAAPLPQGAGAAGPWLVALVCSAASVAAFTWLAGLASA